MKGPNKWELSRRQLLRDLGLGAACLPLLHAGTAHGAATKKLLIVAGIEGYRMDYWLPADGPLQTPPPTLAAIGPQHTGDLIVLHDLANPGFTGCARCADSDYATIYSGLPPRAGSGTYQEPNGPTVDQVIAHALPPSASGHTSYHAGLLLNLSLLKTAGPGARSCFWLDKQQPINPVLDPVAAYNELFAGGSAPVDAGSTKKLLLERRSILDYVGANLEQFKNRLGTDDRHVMDAHQLAIREVETQLTSLMNNPTCNVTAPETIDLNDVTMYAKVLDAFSSILLAVLRCGISQVATLQLSDGSGTYINFGAFVPGVPLKGTGYKTAYRNWRDLGHNPVVAGIDHKKIVDQWWMSKLGSLITQMKASPAVGGTMFDSSLVLWGNNMQEGSSLDAQHLPWILAGNCGGYFKTGQCLPGKTTTMVLADVCEAMGVSAHPYGATMPGLRA